MTWLAYTVKTLSSITALLALGRVPFVKPRPEMLCALASLALSLATWLRSVRMGK